MIKTIYVVLMFTNSVGGYSTDSSFHVFQGETALEDCHRVRSAMLEFATRKNEGEWLKGSLATYENPDNLDCVLVE